MDYNYLEIINNSISHFIFAFITLFVIVSPVGALLSFISLTKTMTFEEKNSVAKRSVLLACSISLFFAITGSLILDMFSIRVDSLRIAGGILLFTISFDMIQARTSRESITEKEIDASQKRDDIWIFPIALPMLTGPATIATIILLMKNAYLIEYKLMVIFAILATFSIALLIFSYSWRIFKVIGYTGMKVTTRLLGLFLAALAVEMMINGVWNIYQAL